MSRLQQSAVLVVVWLLAAFAVPRVLAAPAPVDVLTVKGAVTPILANYIERGITQAEERGAQAVIIQLDTPGGSVQVMSELVQRMTSARTPIVVYVTPPGAMAASAGTFVVLAGHVAAMAPGTTIGAASPVDANGQDIGQTAEAKAKSILAAQIRGLAQRRGDNALAWAERTVRDAEAATAEEALRVGAIDIVARDLNDLLVQLDGREVIVQGQPRTLATADASVRSVAMNWLESILQLLAEPTIAYLLLILGINALLIELGNPGIGFAGALAAVCLIMAFFGLGMLNVNYAGLALIVLAFILFLIDIKAQSHGALVLGGVLSFALGSALLFNTAYVGVSWTLIVAAALLTAALFVFVVQAGVRAKLRPAFTGTQELIGRVGRARTDLNPEGEVFVWGSLWRARAVGGPVPSGRPVRVERVEGLTLWVRPSDSDTV